MAKSKKHKAPRKKSKKEQADDKRITEELKKIYEEDGRELPTLHELEKPTTSWRKVALMVSGILLLAAAVIWAGFFLFGNVSLNQGGDPVELSVYATPIGEEDEAILPLTSGERSRVTVHYKNTSRVPIASLQIRVTEPEFFLIDSRIPDATENDERTWNLGNLSPRSEGTIELTGVVIGQVGTSENIQVLANYKPANFSSRFDTIISKDLVIDDSIADVEVTAPDKAVPGEEVKFTYKLINPTDEHINGLQIRPILPAEFQILESEPPINDDATWRMDRFEAHAKATFSLTGSFLADAKGLYDIGAATYFEREDTPLLQEEYTQPIDVFGGVLTASLISNGSTDDHTTDAGSRLRISIPFQNGSEVVMKDIRVELGIDSELDAPIDWSASSLDLAGGTRSGQTITWSTTNLDRLSELDAGSEDVIDLVLPLQDRFDTAEYDDRLSLTATVSGRSTTSQSNRIQISTTPVTVQINSDLTLTDRAIYFDENGAVIGSGPVSPTQDTTSTYVIEWNLNNSIHPVNALSVQTTLPPGVTFAGKTSSSIGSLTYAADSRTVRWTITESISRSANAQFHVSVTPTASDVGTFLKLTNPADVEATDTVTEGRIRLQGRTLTTDLDHDELDVDTGIVN